MKKISKNSSILLITMAVFFLIGCGPFADKTNYQERLADINNQLQESLEQIDQLQNESDISRFSNKAKILLGSIDNQIEQYHLLMDRANQIINKEARDRVIRFKQKKAEIEYKLGLLENAGVYVRNTDVLSHSDTVITTRDASGSAVTHRVEPLETDKTEIETGSDTLLLSLRLNEWKYAGISFRNELLNDLQEVKKEVDFFRKRNL
jgi:hypothetical protein